MSLITLEENIHLAYRNIKTNAGSKTAGTDGKTIIHLSKWKDKSLILHVQKKLGWYQPQSVKRVEIPKGNGKSRPLGIPTIMDRLIQQCILQVLEPICEAKFHERSNGFRPNRSAEHTMAQAEKCMQNSNLHHVVDIDIKGFFDNVNHAKLLKQIWTLGIRDKKRISILSTILKAEVAGIGFPRKGTLQGGIISPLLSNIVLNELDWWVSSQWETIPTRHPYKGSVCPNGYANAGFRYTSLKKMKLKECYIIRYADDFKIFCRYSDTAKRMFYATKLWLRERLGLEISPEKSKAVNVKKQYSEFLGFRLKVHPKGKNRDGSIRYTVKTRMTPKALKSVSTKLKQHVHDIQHSRHTAEHSAIQAYNAFVFGVHNYYRIASYISKDAQTLAFQFDRILKCRLKDRLQRAGNALPTHISKRYEKSLQLRYISGYPLIPIGYFKYRPPLHKRRSVNDYTEDGRELIHKKLQNLNMSILFYMMKTPNPWASAEFNDNRISLYSAQKGKCSISGSTLEIDGIFGLHCHHIVPRHKGGTDGYDNLTIVTFLMHKLLHATNPSIIEKYLPYLGNKTKALNKLNKYRTILELPVLSFDNLGLLCCKYYK